MFHTGNKVERNSFRNVHLFFLSTVKLRITFTCLSQNTLKERLDIMYYVWIVSKFNSSLKLVQRPLLTM